MGRKRKHSEVKTPDTTTVEEQGAHTPGQDSSDPPTDDSGGSPPPIQRNAANERERARMRVLSKAFNKLKTSLPWVPPDTKLSKLDTLRLASCYIAHLSKLLAEDDAVLASGGEMDVKPVEKEQQGTKQQQQQQRQQQQQQQQQQPLKQKTNQNTGQSNTYVHPMTLTWPFTFNNRGSCNTGGGATSNRPQESQRSLVNSTLGHNPHEYSTSTSPSSSSYLLSSCNFSEKTTNHTKLEPLRS